MKTITIRDLHEKTGQWVRLTARHHEIHISDRGRTIARMTPLADMPAIPYFQRRKLIPAFRQLIKNGKDHDGTDSTQTISEDRDQR